MLIDLLESSKAIGLCPMGNQKASRCQQKHEEINSRQIVKEGLDVRLEDQSQKLWRDLTHTGKCIRRFGGIYAY